MFQKLKIFSSFFKLALVAGSLLFISCRNKSSVEPQATSAEQQNEPSKTHDVAEPLKSSVSEVYGKNLSLKVNQYFDFIDLDRSGLEKIKNAVQSEQWEEAAEELLAY